VLVGGTGVGVRGIVGGGVFVANQPGVPARFPVAQRAISARPARMKSPARTPINARPDFCFLRYEASGLWDFFFAMMCFLSTCTGKGLIKSYYS